VPCDNLIPFRGGTDHRRGGRTASGCQALRDLWTNDRSAPEL